MALKIDKEACVGCGGCAATCPVGVLLKQEEQDYQQQQVPRIHTIQVKLVQQMPEKAGESVDGPAARRGRWRRFPVRRLLSLCLLLWLRRWGRRPVIFLLLGDAGVCSIVIANVTVIHLSSLPSRQKFLSQVEQAGQLQRPFDLLLSVRLQIGPQSVEKLPGVGVVLAAKLLDERQELRQYRRVHTAGQAGKG